MPAPPRHRLWVKIVRFARGVALDFLIPDPIDKAWKTYRNFHQCFLVTDLRGRMEIFRELDEVSPADEAELIDVVVEKWAEQMPPGCPLPPEARQIAEQMVKGLRAAKTAAAAGRDAGEALRNSLNARLPGGRKLDAPKLDAAQQSIGRLLMASRLEAAEEPRQPLPADAPRLPGYTFLRVIGAGGFGTVWLTRHDLTGTLRAVKVGPLTDPARFRQEVALAGRLDSPHLVKYFESDEAGGRFWIAMEYLGDTTLADLMARPDFRSRPFLLPRIGEQLLAGLAALHAAGMIHRDLKPANVMVDDRFLLKLIDFGLAKPVDKLHGYASTATGTLIGTPFYMSPEQLKGKKNLTPASDVYSAGTLLYELFVGRPPHQADNFADVVLKAYTEAIPFDLPALPPELRSPLGRCLKLEAAERFPDGRQALDAYRGLTRDACLYLRHEHFKPAWVAVLKRDLLQKFAAAKRGVWAADAVAQFQRAVRRSGSAEVDAGRLAKILPLVFAAQRGAHAAEMAVVAAKQRLAAEEVSPNSDQVRERADEILRLEAAASAARARVTAEVHRLLADEVTTWQSLVEAERQAAAAAEEKRREEARVRLEADLRRDEADERRRHQEREARARRRAKLRAGTLAAVKYLAGKLTAGNFGVGMKYLGALTLVLIIVSCPISSCARALFPYYSEERVLTGHAGDISSLACSPDGTRLASGGGDGAVRVWDAATGRELQKLAGHTRAVRCVACSPDGTRLASGGGDGTVRVWDAATGGGVHNLAAGDVTSVAFSPDGTRLTSRGGDGAVRVWDATGRVLEEASVGRTTALAFSPDGTRRAGSEYGFVWVGAATGGKIWNQPGHAGDVTALAFSPDGTRLASGGPDQTVRVWEAATGRELQKLTGHAGGVTSVAFSPDGTRLASASKDKTIRIWKRLK